MRAVWVPLAGAFAVAVATIVMLPSATQAQQSGALEVSAAPVAQPSPSPAAKPAAPAAPSQAPAAKPAAAPAAQPSPAAKPAAAPAQAPAAKPAASPAALPRTGEADPGAGMWAMLLAGAALIGTGSLIVARRRGSA